MAAAHTFLSPRQFEELYTEEAKPHFEYWFGKATQKPMPTAMYSALALVIAMLLLKRGWQALPEVRLKLSQLAYPVPDIVADPKPIESPYLTKPFALCVEILMPGDRLSKTFDKAAHYLDWGVATVWIIDSQKQLAYSMSASNPQPVPVTMSGFLTAGTDGHEMQLLLSEIFGEVERTGLIHETC